MKGWIDLRTTQGFESGTTGLGNQNHNYYDNWEDMLNANAQFL